MAKKDNSVPVKKIMELLEDNVTTIQFDGKDGETVEVSVMRTIPLDVMQALVRNASEACFGEDGEYRPELRDFAIRLGVLIAYTNLTMPKDPMKQYALCYGTPVFKSVLTVINNDQYWEIVSGVDCRIERIIDTQKNAPTRELMDGLKAIVDLFAEPLLEMAEGAGGEETKAAVINLFDSLAGESPDRDTDE